MDDVGSIVEPTSSLAWADVIHTDFQTVISRIQNISTCLSRKAQRWLRTIYIQKSEPKSAYLPNKIVAVIDRFCLRHHWWRRLQPTSSVSPVSCPHIQLIINYSFDETNISVMYEIHLGVYQLSHEKTLSSTRQFAYSCNRLCKREEHVSFVQLDQYH